ncbi:MAG: acetyl-CoA decarbonylase/synthase complex subunit delta [Chloroflexota bacterium]
MSRYIATRAIRGANALVTEAELMLNKALAEKGPDTPVAFPNTAYYLPVIYGMTGREVTRIGDLTHVVRHARELLHPVPSRQKWTPYLGETLDSGMATLLAAETIEAIRFVYGLQPEPFPGIELAGGTSYGSNGSGNIGHLNGPIDDIQLRSWGIQLVDGRMPGFAAIVGAAKSNEVAVKIVRELQRRNILCFLSGNVNGRSIIHQLQEEGVELGYDTYTVPFGTDTISAIYALGFATRSALTFGGIKPGQARDILLYNKQRVFAFVLALGEVDDLKYAAAAGAINYGFPVIADTVIPEILPTGVTTYEHVVSMPFNEIEGKDDLERAEILVQKCIEVRGVKIKVADVPVPVPYGSAFEGEVVRKADMRIEFGGKYARCFEYLRMVDMDQVQDGKVEIVGPTFDDIEPQGHMDLGIVIEVAGRQMQKDFEPVLERQVHYFINGASGIQHIGQRDIAWIRISNAAAEKGFSLEHFGKILHARYHADFGAIVDKVQVTLYTDKAEIEAWLARAREAYDYRNKRLEDLTDTAVDEFYSCTLCVPPDQDIMLADGSFLPIETLIHQAVDHGLRPVMTFAQDRLTSHSMGELFINPAPSELVCIRLKNGNDLTLTANHKVLVDRPEGLLWVAAGKLQAGDYVLDALPELEETGEEPPYIVDFLPEDYKVADDAFYPQLRAWTLARYPRLTEAARAFGLPYRRLYSALYPRQGVSHQRLAIGEIKTALAALNQEWDAVKRTLRCFQSKAVLHRAQLDADLLYVAGLVASDGCVRWRGPEGRSGVFVQFTNTEPALVRRFNEIVSQVFGHAPTQQTHPPKTSRSDDLTIEGRREVTVSVAANTLLGRLLNGLGIGLPGQEQKWNGYAISALSPDLVAAFLRGLFDGDGHVSGQRVLFTTRTKVEARHIHLLLKRLGIVSYISPIARGYQVATSSDGDALRFRERVGTDHPAKRARLDAITLRQDEHHVVRNDTIPLSCHKHLTALVERYPIPVTRLPVDGKTLLNWRKGESRPSKAKLAAVLDALSGIVPPQDADYAALRAWTQADVRLQKVREVVSVPSQGERVYNFSVEHTHNYVVNGVIVKNCQSFAPDHVCIVSPERLGLCGAYNWLDCKASFSINPTGPNQPIKLGQILDPGKGYWQGTNEYAAIGSHGTVQKVAMYSIMENPMTACGCFECIVMLIPEANGVMVVSREDTSMTPAGMTFSTLAGMAGGGLQTPGVMGVGKYYLISPKFISADGGLKRVVWMSSILKETMAEELHAAAEREGVPELLDKIADERTVTDVDELVAWLEEHNHPALAMGPMEAGAASEAEVAPASAISQAEAVLDTPDEVAPAVEPEPEPALPEPAQAAVEPPAEPEPAMTPEPVHADLPPGEPGAPESPAAQQPPAPVPPAAVGDAGAAFFDQLRRALAAGLLAAARELGADVSGVQMPAPTAAPMPLPAVPAQPAPPPQAPPAEPVKAEAPAPPKPAEPPKPGAPPKKALAPDKPWLSAETKTEIVKEKWPGRVREVTLGATKEQGGTRARALTVGGESALPFMFFEGNIPHRPAVAIEIMDKRPEDWSPMLLRAWGKAANDPAQWAKAAESAGADALVLALSLTDADGKPNTPERAVATTKAVLQASGLPLIVWGPGQAEADNALLVPIAEATAGERLALGICEDKNYRTIVATAMANNHLVIARTAMDVNLAKQLNILISDMGLPLDRVLMDPTTGALGYGIEYGYSVMERLRLAALQGDAMTQLPMIVTPGYEAWKAKESKVGEGVPEAWGDWEARAIHWETLTAMALVESAANIVVLRHPESVKRVRLAIDDLMSAK